MSGVTTEEQRQVFFTCGYDIWKRCGVDVILLGGTDLFLAFDGRDCGFPYINCADVHLAKVVESERRNDTKI